MALEGGVNCSVVALRRARGENDFRRMCTDQFSHLGTCRLDDCFQLGAELVGTRWIAPFRGQIGHHRFQSLRKDGRRSIVIEVDHTALDRSDLLDGSDFLACAPK
jgi:hypothetical protein